MLLLVPTQNGKKDSRSKQRPSGRIMVVLPPHTDPSSTVIVSDTAITTTLTTTLHSCIHLPDDNGRGVSSLRNTETIKLLENQDAIEEDEQRKWSIRFGFPKAGRDRLSRYSQFAHPTHVNNVSRRRASHPSSRSPSRTKLRLLRQQQLLLQPASMRHPSQYSMESSDMIREAFKKAMTVQSPLLTSVSAGIILGLSPAPEPSCKMEQLTSFEPTESKSTTGKISLALPGPKGWAKASEDGGMPGESEEDNSDLVAQINRHRLDRQHQSNLTKVASEPTITNFDCTRSRTICPSESATLSTSFKVPSRPLSTPPPSALCYQSSSTVVTTEDISRMTASLGVLTPLEIQSRIYARPKVRQKYKKMTGLTVTNSSGIPLPSFYYLPPSAFRTAAADTEKGQQEMGEQMRVRNHGIVPP